MTAPATTFSKKVRLVDLARELDLSTCTVSLAMKGDSRISAKTCDRVRRLAAKMNYTPNLQARSLRTQTTQRIGVVLPELDNPIFIEKLRAIHGLAAENGYALDFSCTHWDLASEVQVIQDLLARQADGLILLNPASFDALEHIEQFIAQGKPVCALGPVPKELPGVSTIYSDPAEAMTKAVEYLISLGHRSFGLLGIDTQSNTPQHQDRLKGIYRALQSAGLGPDATITLPSNGEVTEHGYEAVRLYHRHRGELPSAIVCLNDSIALGALSALYQLGLGVPRDVSVIGYDNIEAAAYAIPPLTTLDQKPPELGRMAIELLFEQIRNRDLEPRHILHVPELIVRQSTGIVRQ